MTYEILFAGFGGQGIMSMGKFLAYGGMDDGLHVSWCPSYGPEMRGGTANCSVILSDDDIGAPVITEPDVLVVMNRPSLDKFEHIVKPGGLIIVDSDLVNRSVERKDLTEIRIPSQTIATEIGAKTIANMILLGAVVEKIGVIPMDVLLASLKEHGKESFFEMNKLAIEKGIEAVRKELVTA
jgi:2-oxoglutarate ferredoxin oxidoreductase subunit gamma